MAFKTASRFHCPALVLVAVFCLLVFGGCSQGPPTAEVSGSVKFQGKPLSAGRVSLLSDDGRVEWSVIKDGQYSTKQAPTGTIKVGIEPGGMINSLAANPKFKRMGGMMKSAEEQGHKVGSVTNPDKEAVKIPSKYLDPQKSGFSFEVKPGEKKTFNIDIP